MKKRYAIIITLLPFFSFAQPTITQSDLPFAGLGFILASDSNYINTVPAGGAAQTWDYSMLNNNYPDTNGFLDAAGTPYAGNFPGSNLASFNAATGQWSYFTTDNTGFYVDGFDTMGTSFHLIPGQLFEPVPFTYTDTRSQTANLQIDTIALGFTARIIIHFVSDFEADGYGTLILPNNTYNNILRIKIIQQTIDSIFIDPLQTGSYVFYQTNTTQKVLYRWAQHGGTANYLLGVDADSLGTTTTKSAYLLQYAVAGIKDLAVADNSLNVFPNPSADIVHFNFISLKNENAILTIFNSLGEKLKTFSISSNLKLDVAVNNFDSGIYFYSLISDKENLNGKFCVMR